MLDLTVFMSSLLENLRVCAIFLNKKVYTSHFESVSWKD